MPKIPSNEDHMWALAYSLATALLTLGYAISRGPLSPAQTDNINDRAKEIANNAINEMQKRKVV